MNRLAALALTAAILTPVSVNADDAGRWMDTRNHIMFGDLPESSEAVARLQYAKAVCHQREGTQMGDPITARYMPCMKGQGFVWLNDSPAQIATREKAVKDAQWRGMLSDLGDALAQGAAARPRNCTGSVFMGGHFTVQCY
jgi:hypothetical protein